VALTTLAVEAAPMLRTHHLVTYALVGTGLLFVLSFWAAALIHAISIVSWPMDLIRYFLYFALALTECLLFAQMERPHDWFGYTIACFVVALVLYAHDFRVILSRRAEFESTDASRHLFRHVLDRQRLEMLVLVPAGLAYSIVAYVLTARAPGSATVLAIIQLLFALFFVVSFLRSFATRQKLIAAHVAQTARRMDRI
jgi:hypothetical protein